MLRLCLHGLPSSLSPSPLLLPCKNILRYYAVTKTSQISTNVKSETPGDVKKKKKGYKPRKHIFKYFMLHKPYHELYILKCNDFSFSPQKPILNTTPKSNLNKQPEPDTETTKKTLQNYFAVKDVYPIGRLDGDSEGLLLLTDNVKGITQKLLHPNEQHERTYLAQVEGIPTKEALEQLRKGVKLTEYTTLPALIEVLEKDPGFPERNPPIRSRKNSPTSWLKLVLIEGKNRQVRHMTAAVGFPTLRLIRTNFAGLELGDLKSGKYRPLTDKEVLHIETKGDLQDVDKKEKKKRKGRKERGPFQEVEKEGEIKGVKENEEGEAKEECEVTRTEAYTAARLLDPNTHKPLRVDFVGVDIGKAHTGICGFSRSMNADETPYVTAVALLHAGVARGRAAHFACDVLDELFACDVGLAWVRASDLAYIEQQVPLNPQAKQVAQGIRSALRCLRMTRSVRIEDSGAGVDYAAARKDYADARDCVTFVAGQAKYGVATSLCPDRAYADPLRAEGVILRGHKNKPKRKLLGERDAFAILDSTNQKAAVKMITRMCEGVDQIHDITDAMLIGLAGDAKRTQDTKMKEKKRKKN